MGGQTRTQQTWMSFLVYRAIKKRDAIAHGGRDSLN